MPCIWSCPDWDLVRIYEIWNECVHIRTNTVHFPRVTLKVKISVIWTFMKNSMNMNDQDKLLTILLTSFVYCYNLISNLQLGLLYCIQCTVYTLLSMVSVSVHSTHTQCPANPKSYVLLMTTGDNYITIFIWIHNDNIGSLLREMPAQTKLNSDLVLSGFDLFTGIQSQSHAQ